MSNFNEHALEMAIMRLVILQSGWQYCKELKTPDHMMKK